MFLSRRRFKQFVLVLTEHLKHINPHLKMMYACVCFCGSDRSSPITLYFRSPWKDSREGHLRGHYWLLVLERSPAPPSGH